MLKKYFIFGLILVFVSACSSQNSKQKVVIYSPHTDPLLENIAERFEAETGIYVEFVQAGTDAAVERIRSEKDSPKADVLYGGSASYMEMLKKEGLLEKSNPTWKDNIDPMFVDKDGYWYGPMQTPAVLFYNTNNVKGDLIPKDWSDLTNSKFKDKLLWLRAGGTANIFLAVMVYQFEKQDSIEGAWKFLKKI